ncbi:lipocalin family protein [Flavobacterium silvaticum]|uniref:Lipocalin-like domain-containing protein n=1 Tax=Flavobacterium silvaticum TaxID=1852020 RepID=A0A972G2I1_9FLAO|nr:lipocalin family protein [Flavobacterium silvaticum]NMH29271.1 hypothetical protein [Flavobacterium silvaticum]
MRKCIAILVVSLMLSSCAKVSKEDLSLLNGYWQIEKVVLADGTDKDYSANTSYDYFEIKGTSGFRQKVMPQYDGSFLTNTVKESFTVVFSDEVPRMDYKTDFAKWSEQLETLDKNHLVVKNSANIEYHYKKAAPINLLGDGKATK